MGKTISQGVCSILLLAGMLFSANSPTLGEAASLKQGPLNPPGSGSMAEASEPVVPKVSRAVRDLPLASTQNLVRHAQNSPKGSQVIQGTDTHILDPLAATSLNQGNSPTPLFTFEGIGDLGLYTPPDTYGEVGPNHYIQIVNVKFAVYDKTGNLLYGPVDNNSLWSSYGGPCANDNDGDPIVLYDDMADRWLISQFAITSGMYQCIAISTSPDPLGTYYLYGFSMPDFPDYPKFGIWPDGYYLGTNTGTPNQYYAHVFDRVKMLAGLPATRQSFGGYANFLMPADADGSPTPPAGAPEYFYTYYSNGFPDHPAGADRIAIYEFNVDWATPGNTTFNLVTEIPIAAFNYTVCGFFGGNCIPEPAPGVGLDSLSWWPMVRLQYRNFGKYEAMVGNFTVDRDGTDKAAIRWFELRKHGSDPWALFQESTYSPDASHRWMGSIAMDGSGNIALGYSVSDATITKPSIRYAVHQYTDAPGTMQAEASVIEGTGVNTGPYGRWGDYSAMSVDPVDQCTFWYTNEYHDLEESSFDWNTRIGVFKVPSCTGSINPTGILAGGVTGSASNLPLPGASIAASASITQTGTAVVNASGQYSMLLPASESYTVTASQYGYLPSTITGIAVISGTTTTQDFVLDPAPLVTVQGKVTDSQTGWPLYAKITIGGYPGGPIWTNPVDGSYSIDLASGNTFNFKTEAFTPGYLTASEDVLVNSSMTKDIALNPNPDTCNAPGYLADFSGGIDQDFEAWPPSGWSIVDNISGGGLSWEQDLFYGDANYTGGNGHSADVNSDKNQNKPYDTELWSPAFDLSALATTTLQYKLNYQDYSPSDALDLDISTDDGVTWSNLRHFTSNQGSSYATPGATDTVDLSAYGSETNLVLRWRYYTSEPTPWDWYAQIDEVRLGGPTIINCDPLPGGLVVGNVYDANTSGPITNARVTNDSNETATTVNTPDDPMVEAGFYTLFSPAGSHIFTATLSSSYGSDVMPVTVVQNDTIRQDFYLPAGKLVYAPSGLNITLQSGATATLPLTLTNSGGVPAIWELKEMDKGVVTAGKLETPLYGLPRHWRQSYPTSREIKMIRPAVFSAPLAAGNVLQSWAPSQSAPWGIAYDSESASVWVSEGWGSNEVFEYQANGTPTGRSYSFNWNPIYGPADMAFNWNTGMLWIMDVGTDDCIHEIDPANGPTGNKICPSFPVSERGLAYDPSTDTWYAGSWNDTMIYQFDSTGTLLNSWNTALSIAGLAFNPESMHLFVMTNSSPNPVYVLDAANNLAMIGQFFVSQGFGDYSGAGMEFDCEGNLWAVDQGTGTVYEIESGETTFFCTRDVLWLSESPVSGTLTDSSEQAIDVTFNTNVPEPVQPGTYRAQLKIKNDTPYILANIPVTMTVGPADTWGKLEGTVTSLGYCDANPTPLTNAAVLIEAGSGFTQTVTTDANGKFHWWLDETLSPLTVTVSAADHQNASVTGVVVNAQQNTTADLNLHWLQPCVNLVPNSFDVTIPQGYSQTLPLTLENNGALDTEYSISEKPGSNAAPISSQNEPGSAPERVELTLSHPGANPNAFLHNLAPSGAIDLQLDDGSAENSVGLSGGGQFVWINRFTPDPLSYPFSLDTISALFNNTVMVGDSMQLVIWEDTDGDIDPGTGANFLYSETVSVQFNDLSTWNTYSLATPVTLYGPGDILIGVVNRSGSASYMDFPAAIDENVSQQRSWIGAYASGDPPDPPALPTDSLWGLIDDFGLAGNWTLRASGSTGSQEDVDWLSESPANGTISAGGFSESSITFDTMTYTTGTHAASLKVKTGDPNNPILSVPITMTIVSPTYGVNLAPPAETGVGKPGETVTYTLRMTNTGNTVDSFDLSLTGNAWTTEAPLTIGPLASGAGAGAEVVVHIPAGASGGASDTATMTAASQGDPGQSAASVLTTSAQPTYGVNLVPPAETGFGNPGETVTYTLRLTNTGNTVDSFALSLTGNAWTTEAPLTVGPLASGAGADAEVIVHIPAGASGGTSDTATVTAASQGDPGKSAASVLTTSAQPTYGVSLAPPAETGIGNPGDTVTYTLRLTNIGNTTDAFFFSLSGNNWTTETPLMVGPLAGGEKAGALVVVHIPAGASGGTSDTATVTAASQGDPGQSAASVLTTSVQPTYGVSLAPPAETGIGNPGETVTYTLRLTNTGNTVDSFDLSLTGNAWTTEAPLTVGPLASGAGADAEVVVHIPAGASRGASDTAIVTAASQGDPGQSAASVLTTSVIEVFDVSLSAEDDSLSSYEGTTVEYTLHLTNTGNSPDTYTLSYSGNDPTWIVQMPATEINLQAGESQNVKVDVTIPVGAGSGKHDTVRITAVGSGGSTASVNLTTTSLSANTSGTNLYLPVILKVYGP